MLLKVIAATVHDGNLKALFNTQPRAKDNNVYVNAQTREGCQLLGANDMHMGDELFHGPVESLAVTRNDLLKTGTYLIAVSACNSLPTFVIKSAGRNSLTHILEMSREDDSLSMFHLEATTP